jgi:hypothetical protein
MRRERIAALRLWPVVGVVVVGATLLSSRAEAMPMFGRKYKMDCSGCHSPVVPRLNAVGYKFRRAGFRMPEQIGQEEVAEFTLGDYFSGKIQSDYRVSREAGETENRFENQEVSLFAVTGSFQKYFASETEIGLSPVEGAEIENAYLRAVWGGASSWLQARAGVFHPIEGFGASDRPLGISLPLFQSFSPNHTQDTLARVSSLDRVGIEVGAQWHDTSLNVAVLNELELFVEEAEIGASGTRRSLHDSKDLLISATQLFGERNALGAYWARGALALPVDPVAFADGTSVETWRNRYDRLALFATAGAGRWTGLAAASLGFDHSRDMTTGALSTFRSAGGFVEGDVALGTHVVTFLRLDYFDPSLSQADNGVVGGALGAPIFVTSAFLIPEIRYQRQPPGSGGQSNTAFVVRAFITY